MISVRVDIDNVHKLYEQVCNNPVLSFFFVSSHDLYDITSAVSSWSFANDFTIGKTETAV